MAGFVVFICFCVAMFLTLYFTYGKVHRNLKARLNKYKNVAFKLVSAGSVAKDFNEAVVYIKASSFSHDGESINADKYTFMVVDGNSMERFGVKDGMVVMVDDDKSLSSKDDTIFVLKINNHNNTNKIEYKLRRAIDFYDCIYENREAFDIWVKNHPELDADELYEKYEKEYTKIDECKRFRCRLLVSETTRDGKPYYSFHPEKCIYGKVKYKIPRETVKILEKR
ncbi:MAG: hypothetical protein LBC68_04650 [Prevotellaceae bacterium]|jgi:hypothetical protein|nr:hypothetical protein [Prevotellaceae bacterium]